MKQIVKSFLICLLVLVLGCISAFAAGPDFTVSYDGGDSEIVILGTAGVEKANRQITLQVIREGADVNDVGFDPDNDILYMRQTMTDVNGDFSFTFTLDESGEHTVRVSESGDVATPITLYRSTPEELEDAKAKLNAEVGDPAGIDAVIIGDSGVAPNKPMMKILQIDAAEYAAHKADSNFLPNLSARTYDSVADFKNQYALAKLLVDLTNATDGDTIKALLEENEDVISFAGKYAADIFDTYSESAQASIYSAMAEKDFAVVEDVQKTLYEAVIVKELADKETAQAKYSVIVDHNDVLELDLFKASGLGTYVEDFKDELAREPLSSLSSIRNSFNTLTAKYQEIKEEAEEDDDSDRGFGGGIGGGRPTYVDVGNELTAGTPVTETRFSDIGSVTWAHEAINALAEKGVIAGKAVNTFAPQDNITRAEFVKILMGAFGMADAHATADFADVPANHWAHAYVAAAAEKGIVNGVGEGWFGANDSITRQDIVTLCYRLAESLDVNMPGSATNAFKDADTIAEYAKVAASKMKAAGIVNGREGNVFDPASFATRAEATKIIYETMQFCLK